MLPDVKHASLLAFARSLVRDEDAEDVVQTAYVKMLTTTAHFRGESSKLTWACSIVRSVAIDLLRSRAASPIDRFSTLPDRATPPAPVDDQIDGTAVFAALDAREQELLLWRDRTAAEVARAWRCPTSRVKDARRRLRARIVELTAC